MAMGEARMERPMGPLRRTVRNAAWLLGGKGAGGLFSLVYLALATRSLGVTAFGQFTLVLAYGQAVANLAGFQSWQAVIRFGAKHLVDDAPDRLRRVLCFTALLDFGAAVAGSALASAGVLAAGPLLGWAADEQRTAALFGLSLVFSVRGTPTGILRLFNRFDLAAYTETVLPAARLAGAACAWLAGATVAGFLAAWALAELATSVAMWAAAYHELGRRGLARGRTLSVHGVTSENAGLWRFVWMTSLSTSVGLVWQQLPTLALGSFIGPAMAGGYRVASQLSSAVSKPALSLSRAIYPELAKIAHANGIPGLKPVLQRSTAAAAALGMTTVLLLVLLGKPLIGLVAGPGYAFAYPFLVLLAVAAAIELCAFALEPALVALGHAGTPLKARAAAGVCYVLLIAVFLQAMGPVGVSVAAVCASLAFVLLLSWSSWRLRSAAG